ncbi:MAG: DegT/DnrJ/EryC1/StrS family aminotransferase [Candidatus Beckwithbacteria bacterium]|nr:DegT/DnrJ/EryC1/StrS family aminotransferase [Candidatus Beckwithbacteria bacterium]
MNSFIPLAKPVFGSTEKKLVNNCLNTGWISSIGSYVEEFAVKLAKFVGVKYALSVGNGTAALHLALIALGIGSGDEVIVPALTFVASANAITYTGAKAVFVDIEPQTYNLDINKIEAKITSKTKAIMTVDLYGHPVDFDKVKAICRKYNLKLISDSAESLGSLYKGKPTGRQADISTFSFFGNKIVTTGEGGMITTNNKKYYNTAKFYRDQAKKITIHPYYHPAIGYNYAMTNLQAAVGIGQLQQLPKFIRQKRRIAQQYTKLLKNIPGVIIANEAAYAKSNYWMYSILIDKNKFGRTRNQLMAYLKTKNIETRPFFFPIPLLPAYKAYNCPQDFPATVKIASQGMNLPTFASLAEKELQYICRVIEQFSRLV